VKNNKQKPATIHRRLRYTSNAALLHDAALSLGYKITYIIINGKKNINRFGFYVEHKNRRCYISAKSYFPGVPRWQLALMDNKLITTAVLEQNYFSVIRTVSFTSQDTITLTALHKQIFNQPLPILIKPTNGSDGSGVQLCYTKKQAVELINEYYYANTSFLAQPFIEKDEYRITVANKKIGYIHLKKFPTVTGDGIKTIADLISKAKYLDDEVVRQECKKLKLTIQSVLPKGKSIKTHITKKSDPSFYITDNFPPEIIAWVTKLCDTLGIDSVGIDVFIKGTLIDPSKIIVIELNSKPNLCYVTQYYGDSKASFTIATEILKAYFEK